ncbi:hypothetical protein QCA50_012325 [Cerrena zonata]|uniref:Uncharacterized protein n=1 Tax=Cerrena zonata TaxID=2478898 RepID=A0AAW0G369_9APHY
MDVPQPLDRYNVYMPSGPLLPHPIYVSQTADVDRLETQIRQSPAFGPYFGDKIPMNLFMFGNMSISIADHDPEAIVIWLQANTRHSLMQPSRRLRKYFPDGPAPDENEIIDILVCLDSDSMLSRRDSDIRTGPFSQWKLEESQWSSFCAYWRTKDFRETSERSIIPLAFDAAGETDLSHRLGALMLTAQSFIVPESYRTLFDRVLHLQQWTPSNGVLVTGQPGTGKSTWLWYMLICLITMRKTIVFRMQEETRLFYQNNVYIIPPLYNLMPLAKHIKDIVWCLIDNDWEKTCPPYNLVVPCNYLFPVQTSCSNRNRSKKCTATVLGMPLWSKKELEAGLRLNAHYRVLSAGILKGLSQSPDSSDVDAKDQHQQRAWQRFLGTSPGDDAADRLFRFLIHHATKQYGYAARDVYDGICFPATMDGRIEDAAKMLSLEHLLEMFRATGGINMTSVAESPSHMVIAISPIEPKNPTAPDTFMVDFKSRAISRDLIKQIAEREQTALVRAFKNYRGDMKTAMLAGWMFKGIAHTVLKDMRSNCKLSGSLIPMTNNRDLQFVETTQSSAFNFPLRLREYTPVQFDKDQLEWPPKGGAYGALETCFCVPWASSNPLFDSFCVDLMIKEDHIEPVIWIFQTTISDKHGGSARGYARIHSIKQETEKYAREVASTTTNILVPGGSRVQKAPKTVTPVQLNYVLVGPSSSKNVIHQWTMPEGWTNTVESRVFYQKIDVDV